MGKPAVLVTCTQPRADDIVRDLINLHGIHAMPCPLLKVELIQTPKPSGLFDSLLITSSHALDALSRLSHDLADLPVITVGNTTYNAAKDKGYHVVQKGQGGVQDLNLAAYQSILYPCAMEPSFVPDNAVIWPVYQTVENPEFHIDKTVDVVCLFSVKAALAYHKNDTHHHNHNRIILCLSQSIADILDGKIPVENLAVCQTPSYDAMKELILQRAGDHNDL